jgi:hypothetical protein
MEQKKLSVDVPQKRNTITMRQETEEDGGAIKLNFDKSNPGKIIEGIHDNWYELRFSNVGPDRRGYHSTFLHNKR